MDKPWRSSRTRDAVDQNPDGLTGQRKTQENWIVETGGRLPRKEVADDICLRRPGPTQGCRDDDDDDDDDDDYTKTYKPGRSHL